MTQLTPKHLKGLARTAEKMADTIRDKSGKMLRVITESKLQKAAAQTDAKPGHICIAALKADIWPVRYMRNAGSISTKDQLKLALSHVAIIGAGGLGGHIALACARTGIGRLTIADPDIFEESNLNRQILASAQTLGSNKALAAKKILASINPAVEVRAFPEALTEKNATEILSDADLAADALDSIPARMILAEACRKKNIALVHGAIAGFEGQVMTIFPQDPGLEFLYGNKTQGPCSQNSPEAVLGVPGVTPMLTAAIQTMEIIKILLGRNSVLKNCMLYADLENSEFQKFSMTDPQGTG
jgi:molybdopterin/thiamine biosynthesis adenylyltransferase